MKKPDRFEMLRRQHAAVVRLVNTVKKDVLRVRRIVGNTDVHAQGMLDGVDSVLAALHQYRRGKLRK